MTRWWFQIYFFFTPVWGRFPIWLIFFRWVVQPPTRWMWNCLVQIDFDIACNYYFLQPLGNRRKRYGAPISRVKCPQLPRYFRPFIRGHSLLITCRGPPCMVPVVCPDLYFSTLPTRSHGQKSSLKFTRLVPEKAQSLKIPRNLQQDPLNGPRKNLSI